MPEMVLAADKKAKAKAKAKAEAKATALQHDFVDDLVTPHPV